MARDERRERIPRRVGLAVVGVLLIVFVAQNARRVRVTFGPQDVETPLAWALLVSAVLGFAAGWLARRRR